METFSLLVIIINLYAGMFYVADPNDTYMDAQGLKFFFFFAIFIPNLLFFFYWFYYIRIEILKMALERSKILFSFLTCGLQNSADFKNKYIRDLTVYEIKDKNYPD